MRALITGSHGQLGLDLIDVFDSPVACPREDLDITDEAAVRAMVAEAQADIVVNAAAWTDVDGCEGDAARAHDVNAIAPWNLARACQDAGVALVTVSTDYVFDGRPPESPDGRGFTEFDTASPLNEYGRSKWAGEQLVREALPRHYIVRTAWVCGARGENFVRTMLRMGREQGKARVVDDQLGSPTFTRDLARSLREIAESGRYGTYHRTNSGRCTWYDLAGEIFDLAGMDVELEPMSSDELDRPAARPGFSVLSNLHAERAGFATMPPWQDGLRRLLDELDEKSHD